MNRLINRVLSLSRWKKRCVSVVTDTLFLFIALSLAFSLRLEFFFLPPSVEYALLFGMVIIGTVLVFVRIGLYRAVIRYLSHHALLSVLLGVSISALMLTVGGYFLGVVVPRSVPVIYWAIALIFTGGSRWLVRFVVQIPFRQDDVEHVLIYGAGETGRQLLMALAQISQFRVVAFVDDRESRQGTILAGCQVIGPQYLEQFVDDHAISRVLLALDDESRRSSVIRQLEPLFVVVQTVPSMQEILSGKADMSEIRDLDIHDLLGREPVEPRVELLDQCIRGKVVMVTGAGGSIGSELCRQIALLGPCRLVLFELSEFGLYQIEQEIRAMAIARQDVLEVIPIIGSVQHKMRMEVVMRSFAVETVYHAAAYKHVPIVEHNMIEGVRNNVFGTWHCAEAAICAGVKTFILISTDKAVRPTNVMGTTKRVAELVLQGLARRQKATRFCMVRFGNVLGSSGSVVPLFREQIRRGGPVTVTHPEIYRYFMTIPEAAQLVLQASSMGQGGEVFVLDMGEQVRIVDLAHKMIHLMGSTVKDDAHPEGCIEISYTGLRPGEKLYEELLIGDSPEGTEHPRVMKATELSLSWDEIGGWLDKLDRACHAFDYKTVWDLLMAIPAGFQPSGKMSDLVHGVQLQMGAETQVMQLAMRRTRINSPFSNGL